MSSAAKHFVVLTSMGHDRQGIVDDLSGWILDLGGNLEDSRMALLGGEFATIMLVSGSEELAGRMEESRSDFESKTGLNVVLRPVEGSPPPALQKPVLRYLLEATSLDAPGIVHEVARLLRPHGINIVTASTWMSSAPFSGAPVFHFAMTIDIPNDVSIGDLRKNLSALGDQRNIDFDLAAED